MAGFGERQRVCDEEFLLVKTAGVDSASEFQKLPTTPTQAQLAFATLRPAVRTSPADTLAGLRLS